MKKDDIVTVPLEPNNNAANTYIVYDVLEQVVLLRHPLSDDILIAKPKPVINTVSANVKDSTERGINYILKNKEILDYNSIADLEAIILYFIVHRKLSNRQKQVISKLCGMIAEHYFNNNISLAIKYINENEGILDDFNKMWYKNFKDYFNGNKVVDTKNRRLAIFNMAGFVLAELGSQSAPKSN